MAVWNAERLDAKGLGGGSACSAECRDKRRWIEEYIDGAEPDVVGILEVIANLKQLRTIRKWLRPRGYEAALLAGEGGSRREPGVFTSTNAIIVAVRRSTVQLVSYGRRAERVIGVEVRVKAERRLQRVCFMHGLHGTVKSDGDVPGEHPVRSFPHQLLQAKAWLAEKGGGLLLGDMNKVPCRSWRCSGCDLTGDDRILRAQAGWCCTCCQEEGEQVASDAEIVGGTGAALGVHHTHLRRTFDLSSGHGCAAESRLDYAVAVGTDVSAWSLGRQLRSERDNGRLIADHELVEANRKPQIDTGGGVSRRMPIRMGKDGLGMVIKRTYGDIVCASRWQNDAAAKCAEAVGAGGSAVEPLAASMRAAGEEALQLARNECGMKQRHGQNASGDYNSWTKRLDKARELKSRGASPFAWNALLFHARTGLVDIRNRAARRCGSWDSI